MRRTETIPTIAALSVALVLTLTVTCLGAWLMPGPRLERALVTAYAAPFVAVGFTFLAFYGGRRASSLLASAALLGFVAVIAATVLI